MTNDGNYTYYVLRYTILDVESKMLLPTTKSGAVVVFRKTGSDAAIYRTPTVVEEGNELEVRVNVSHPADAKEVADKLLFRDKHYRTPDFGRNPINTICEDE